ncbi:MAG: methionine aminotransferase [Anaerolineae bacterium]|nr:methionine aminotransferase [Anaerolineae bacterium]
MTKTARRVQGFGTSVFATMTRLAQEHDAINLGQGFPDFPAPDFIKQAAIEAISAEINQYAPANGRPRLRHAVAAKMERHYGMSVDPEREITIMHGATESIFATFMGLVDPGDEVILFEPCYDSYVPCTLMAGGVPRFYTLPAPDWRIDPEQLRALFSPKTRLVVVNTPHNPLGKVFTRDELELIGDLCREFDAIALVDTVYEHIVFDDAEHINMASLPGMRERTVTVSSVGKTFSVTGWKVGWAIAPPELTQAIFQAHQFVTFCGAAPLQEAAAIAIESADSRNYYTELAAMYQTKRNMLVTGLRSAGLKPLVPRGSYFVMVDISDLGFENDVAFCRYLTTEIGVAAIPPSAFYHHSADGANLARFAFCKTDELLDAAAQRLAQLR